ncbi:LamG domain-containing protein [Micromonospora sp. WP24]|uniref:LamG domain-containing protein n=1 Tax=Micromonospora sp. WP24 TaxID=2604469 RepID=UPI0011D9FB4C|nr:LamG domain-containing protein [Micromonospora sp. WP24]TYB97407.1 LamG domain-containing protein [Micromonospora sp. WP24]
MAPDAASAAAQARRSGLRVEVGSARTELTQVFANPSGGFTAESAVVPQRVMRSDGSWADVDLSLRAAAGGVLRPVASVADVRFSGGGAGPAVTLVRQGRSLSLSWPGGLPAPSVAGDAATYPEVLPGTDLVLRATRTGFTHVFVVKSALAAANPVLRALRFDLSGDARVVRGLDGRLTAVAGDQVIASAEPAVMWDSNTTPAAAARSAAPADGGGRPSESSATAPGDVARTSQVGVDVAGGDLVLRPDTALLSKDAAYPVFIDPAWSTGKSRWAYATNNNSNNTDTSVARVGRDPDSGKLYRSYFDFPLTSMKGKHIESAYVQMKLDHSWSCGNTPTYMYHSGGIASTPRTAWAPKLNSLKSSANSHANEGSGCSDSPQPDMTVNFTGSAVTSIIQTHATSNATNITFGFCACSATSGTGESTTDRWKKFFPNNAKLVVDFDNIPGKPNSLQIAGVACSTTSTKVIGSTKPTFSAIFPDADSTQALTTGYEWVQVPADGVIVDSTPRKAAPAGASVPAGGRSTTAAVTVSEGITYAFRAKATDPAPYSRTSVWSDWCKFLVDTTVPDVNVLVTGGRELPGEQVTFTIYSRDLTVPKFRYGWVDPATTEVAAVQGTVQDPTSGLITVKKADVSLVVPKYGINVLYVRAFDGVGNLKDGSAEFTAERPSPAIARWGLETYPGVTAASALKDSQPALGGDNSLTSGSVSWAGDLRLIRGETASFNGTSSSLSTTAKVVDTTDSFSVAAWVRLNALPTTDDTVVAAQEATNAAGFHLGTRLVGSPLTPRWSFLMKDSDVQASTTRAAFSSTALTTADIGRWTHIAGVYDRTAQKVRLYVNGTLTAEVDRTAAPWSAGGRFTVGRGWSFGAPGNWFKGNLVDVQVYDRVLVAHDFSGQLAEDPSSGGFDEPGMLNAVKVGDWDFSGATPCYEESTDPFLCGAREAGQFGRRLALAQGSNVGSGHRDDGLSLDEVHWVEDPNDPYFGLATREYGRSQDNLGDPQNPSWQEGRVLRTNESFSVSVWVRPSSLGTQTAVSQLGTKQSAFYLGQRPVVENGTTQNRWSFTTFNADSDVKNSHTALMRSRAMNEEDDLSRWTHLVGVQDVARREIRLYVNGVLEDTLTFGADVAFDSSGPLMVGAAQFTPVGGATMKITDRWLGDVDDLGLYQGVLTDAAVKALFEAQSVEAVEPVD